MFPCIWACVWGACTHGYTRMWKPNVSLWVPPLITLHFIHWGKFSPLNIELTDKTSCHILLHHGPVDLLPTTPPGTAAVFLNAKKYVWREERALQRELTPQSRCLDDWFTIHLGKNFLLFRHGDTHLWFRHSADWGEGIAMSSQAAHQATLVRPCF